MADLFPSNVRAPSYSPRKKVMADILESQFEGYSQRTPNGLNYLSEEWSVNWNVLPEDEAETLDDFLNAHRALPFEWTPPGQALSRLFICKDFDRGHTSGVPD